MNKKETSTKPKIEKELSKEEILTKLRSALMILRMKSKMGQLIQTHQIKKIKKDIARLLTKSNFQKDKENKT
jgi:ribosomal protein L29